MRFEEISKRLRSILARQCSPFVIENLVMQSSHISFDKAGETIFEQGDAPLGFYWILEGTARVTINPEVMLTAGPGKMVGLEEFIERRVHRHRWETASAGDAIFIDRRGFEQFLSGTHSAEYVFDQLAEQLVNLKNQIGTDHWPSAGYQLKKPG